MKADVWRYAALAHFGSVYLDDKSYFPHDAWEDTSKARLHYEGTPEREVGADIAVANHHLQVKYGAPKVRDWCLAAPRNSPFFHRVLFRLCRDCVRYIGVAASMHEKVLAPFWGKCTSICGGGSVVRAVWERSARPRMVFCRDVLIQSFVGYLDFSVVFRGQR